MATVEPFEGFTPEGIQFLADLAQNNERAWFQPRKADYERLLKQPLERLCVALAERLEARGVPLLADPGRSPFRIYRDVRFSRNKEPYKTHLGASFPWVGGVDTSTEAPARGPHGSGGYFHFEPGEMYAGGGMWAPERPRLEAFRRAVMEEPVRVRSALEDEAFTAWFGGARCHESLKRIPPGYPTDHPMAALFLWKDVIFGRRLSDAEVCSPGLPDRLAEGYATAVPVFRFLASLR